MRKTSGKVGASRVEGRGGGGDGCKRRREKTANSAVSFSLRVFSALM